MNYSEARRDAQQKADETGYDHGVAKDAFGEYGVRMLRTEEAMRMPKQRAKTALSETTEELTLLDLAMESLQSDTRLGIDRAGDQMLDRIHRSLSIVEARAKRAGELISALRAERSK